MIIVAKARIDGQILECVGSMEIHWRKDQQAYITWQLHSGDKLIAAKSENFFYKAEIEKEDELVNRVLKKIESYRIGRKKIFDAVKLCC